MKKGGVDMRPNSKVGPKITPSTFWSVRLHPKETGSKAITSQVSTSLTTCGSPTATITRHHSLMRVEVPQLRMLRTRSTSAPCHSFKPFLENTTKQLQVSCFTTTAMWSRLQVRLQQQEILVTYNPEILTRSLISAE